MRVEDPDPNIPKPSQHITIWIRLLMERRFEVDRYTIMPQNFFLCHLLEDGSDWRVFIFGIGIPTLWLLGRMWIKNIFSFIEITFISLYAYSFLSKLLVVWGTTTGVNGGPFI
uniref:Transmembrane protein n=1 Tax=Lactuca sativa TaxID=4236 RepID=A0A9R1W8J9_LACSA|nr:hypothetical protein LSAT_V11C300143150 [Lactuca sativa]